MQAEHGREHGSNLSGLGPKTILVSKNITIHLPCNCRRIVESPLNGNCQKKALMYKTKGSTGGNNLENVIMVVAKRSLNSVFTTIVKFSKTSRKDIPPSYRKPFKEWQILGRIYVLHGAYRPTPTPINPVPPGIIFASM